jgi:hypothetical protein
MCGGSYPKIVTDRCQAMNIVMRNTSLFSIGNEMLNLLCLRIYFVQAAIFCSDPKISVVIFFDIVYNIA